MNTQYESRLDERRIIKNETKNTIKISLAILISIICMGLVASFMKAKATLPRKTLENTWMIFNITIVILTILILAVRKTIYYSPKLIKEDFTLTQILQKWRTIDLILLAAAEIIPVLGLIVSSLGLPFSWTYHYFVASGLLVIILMPLGLKVRSKLTELRKHTSRDWSIE
ncbi:MAG: hypothetical protein L0Y73_04770 [Candidatus Aminicenantes bacterium]|nr:hypothetical protein [Candidatus Aminicenantes bacterium]